MIELLLCFYGMFIEYSSIWLIVEVYYRKLIEEWNSRVWVVEIRKIFIFNFSNC